MIHYIINCVLNQKSLFARIKKSKREKDMKKSIFYCLCLGLMLGACGSGDGGFYGKVTSEVYNETTQEYITEENEYSQIDSYQPRTMAERTESSNRWNTARKDTRWQEYKGAMVRVEVLLGDTEVREMRLRLMQSAEGKDIDADARTILARVADYEMKKVCGRNAESIVIVYDKPSFEVMRPTSFYDYRVEAEGVTMREYGFRCVYNQ